ncbi:MAG: hypothetical protein VZR24_20850, partial [Butyrivibrio hungatei]|nr:hypothetical protein [Butyrivibrio hungatei]
NHRSPACNTTFGSGTVKELLTTVHKMYMVPVPKVVNLSSKASIYAAFRAFLFGKNIENTLDN